MAQRSCRRIVKGALALCLGLGSAVAGLLALGTATGTTAAGAAGGGAPLTIGYICSCTGPLASSLVAGKPAFQAWVASVNAAGGINGHKLNVIYKDDDTSATTSLTDVQQLISDHVLAIVNLSNDDSAWASDTASANIPVIEADSSDTVGPTEANFFPASQTIDSLPISVALAAKKTGAKSFALVYCAESPACQELVAPEKQAAQKAGVPLVYTTSISASAPNFTAQCLAAKQSGATSLFIADAVSVALSVAASCETQGYTPNLIADDGAVATSFETAKGWSNNMIAMQPDIPFFVKDTPATKAMYAAFKKYEPGLTSSPDFNELAVEGWAAGELLGAALQGGHVGSSGTPSTAQVFDGLYSLHDDTLGGIAPPLSFTKGKPTLIDCWFWMRTKDSKFTTPYGLSPVCSKD